MNFGNQLEAVAGDITRADTDAIVNAANTDLWMGAGVAGAIKRAGGQEIEREAVSKGPISLGEAVATTAGTLPHKRVIHAAAMGYRGGSMVPPSAETIENATTAALQVADAEGLGSIAFPALGTGVGGFSIDECAEIMVNAAKRFMTGSPSTIRRVVFVLRDEQARAAFARAVQPGLSGEM